MTECGFDIDWEETTHDGYLFLNGQQMHQPAFAVVDVTDLWLPHTLRGENLLIPGVAGRRVMPKRADETQRAIPLVIDGRANLTTGLAHPNEREGLRYNVKYIENTCCGYGDLVELRLWFPGEIPGAPGARSYWADVEVKGVQVGDKVDNLWAAVIDINIPAGALNGG